MATCDSVKGAVSSTKSPIKHPRINAGEIYTERCELEKEKSKAIIAIEVIIEIMENSSFRTVRGLDDDVNEAVEKMTSTDQTNCSVKSVCDLFQRFITLGALDNPGDVETFRQVSLDRARLFLKNISGYGEVITRNTGRLFGNNFHVLTHSMSKNVLNSLDYIVNNSSNPRSLHCYVTQTAPSNLGERMVEELKKRNVPCSVIPDTAIAYLMPQIDAVVLGAEAVMETGGILNTIGSCSVAMIAHCLGKPVYVLVESFKFLRFYPLNQSSIPDQFKWLPSQIAKIRESQKLPESVPVTTNSRYAAWLDVEKYRQKRVDEYLSLVDYTDPRFITYLVTDLGIISPSAVSDELIKLYL